MQEMTTAICNEATTPAVTATASDTVGNKQGNTAYVPERTLIDSRDNNTYIVRKLADGKCWMVQNLDYHVKNGVNVVSDGAGGVVNWNSSYNSVSGVDLNFAWTISAAIPQSTYSTASKYREWGTWYNWNAATAGAGLSSTVNTNVSKSVCPKGWRLPYGSDNNSPGSFYNLYHTFYGYNYTGGDATPGPNTKFPFSNTLSGGVSVDTSAGVMQYQNSWGFWWSQTATNDVNTAYNLELSTSLDNRIRIGQRRSRGLGLSIRCVSV